MFVSRLRDNTALSRGWYTRDAFATYDRDTIDSTGSFLIGELERLDQTIHEPLIAYTWSRDIDLREDVTIADEVSSFTNLAYAASGLSPNGKNWIGKDVNAIAGMSIDIGKTSNPLTLWGMQLGWTIPELLSAQRLGRPVDAAKLLAMREKHQMDIDEQVYIGDTTLSHYGLLNSPKVTASNVANGAAGVGLWSQKTPDDILADFNDIMQSAWIATGYKFPPSHVLLPPAQFGFIVNQKVSSAGNIPTIEYIRKFNIYTQQSGGGELTINPVKWLTGRGAGGTDRMVAYTRNQQVVRFPMTAMQNTPIEYRGIYQLTTYFCRLGVVEFVYPEAMAYLDGI